MKQNQEMEEIYREYCRPVYLYLYSLCHEKELAEDLTQETFYRATKSIHRFNGECRLLTWLCQIGKHLWYQEVDKRKRRGQHLPLMEETAAAPGDMQADIESDEGKVILFQSMQSLEPKVREIMYLRVMGDLSFKQIGDITGVSENYARVTFYRAKEKLKKGLMQNERNEGE